MLFFLEEKKPWSKVEFTCSKSDLYFSTEHTPAHFLFPGWKKLGIICYRELECASLKWDLEHSCLPLRQHRHSLPPLTTQNKIRIELHSISLYFPLIHAVNKIMYYSPIKELSYSKQ